MYGAIPLNIPIGTELGIAPQMGSGVARKISPFAGKETSTFMDKDLSSLKVDPISFLFQKQEFKTPQEGSKSPQLDWGGIKLPQLDWEGIAKVFADPRATPAFYKMALNLLTDLLGYHYKMAMQREALFPKREAMLPKALDVLGDMITKIDTQLANSFLPEATRTSLALQRQNLMKAYSGILGELMQSYGIPFPTQEATSTQATKPAQALPLYPYTYNPYGR